jgi:serine/threonine protein kinase
MGGQCSCYNPTKLDDLTVEDEAGDDESIGSQRITGRPPPESVPNIDEVYALDIRQEGILGHSSVGAVLKTRHRKSKTLYAVKQMNKKNIEMERGVKEEVRALTSLDHPNICKVSETWEDAMSVYLIMDLCEGGNLTTLGNGPRGVNESSIAALVRQMMGAVSHLHARKMVHSDIKPENWLFAKPCTGKQTPQDMSIKMIDFGLASKFAKRRGRASDPGVRRIPREECAGVDMVLRQAASSNSRRGAASSTALFCRSPEQVGAHLSGEALSDDRLPEKMDVWAVGVIAYFLLSGQSPFQWASYAEDLVRRAKYTFMPQELWRPVSSEAKKLHCNVSSERSIGKTHLREGSHFALDAIGKSGCGARGKHEWLS